MRLSLALIAAASIIAITQVASAAEQKGQGQGQGQGCDLRITPGCKPGAKAQPTEQRGAAPHGDYSGGGGGNSGSSPKHNGGSDKVNSTPQSK
jgi:hypothetical protein